MKLENVPSFLFPKTINLDKAIRSSYYDSVKREDVIAALSYAEKKCTIGINLFLMKIGIISREKMLEMLLNETLLMMKEDDHFNIKDKEKIIKVLTIICFYVLDDYSRSAQSEKECFKCNGKGFINASEFTNSVNLSVINDVLKLKSECKPIKKTEIYREYGVFCRACNGKGKVRLACQCRGRGRILDKKEFVLNNKVTYKECFKCKGRGFNRVKFSTVLREIQTIHPIKKTLAYRYIKPFYDKIIERCYQEEFNADRIFSNAIKCIAT